jgi:hypothetical protein
VEAKQHSMYEICLILLVIFFNLAVIYFSFTWLFTDNYNVLKNNLFGSESPTRVTREILFGFFNSGMIGGAFYCLKSVYRRLSLAYPSDSTQSQNPSKVFNIQVWLFWFFYRPLQSGILALIVMCLFSAGFPIFGASENLTKDTSMSLYYQTAIGFLVGYGTHAALEKIDEIIAVVFSTKKPKTNTTPNDDDSDEEPKKPTD